MPACHSLDPASVNQEWVNEVAHREGISDSYGFTIYIDRFGQLVSLQGSGGKGFHVMDVISKIDRKAIKDAGDKASTLDLTSTEGQFSFRKEYVLRCCSLAAGTCCAHQGVR